MIPAWMEIIAGEELYLALMAEKKAAPDLCKMQEAQAGRGILGVELVPSMYGYSVRYDSGLQDWGLLAGSRRGDKLDGTLEDAERYAREWVAKDPTRRYAWRRK